VIDLKQPLKVIKDSVEAKINFGKHKKNETETSDEMNSTTKFPKIDTKYLKNSLPYYWYTGEKKIAISAGTIGIVISILFLFVTIGTNAISLILVFIADKLMAWGLLLYIFYIRDIIPVGTDAIDNYFIENFIYILIAILINRVIVNLVAENFFNYNLIENKSNNNKD